MASLPEEVGWGLALCAVHSPVLLERGQSEGNPLAIIFLCTNYNNQFNFDVSCIQEKTIKTYNEAMVFYSYYESIKKSLCRKYTYNNWLLLIQLLIHLIQRQKKILTQKSDCSFQTFQLF